MVERAGTATALVAVHQASRSDAAVYDQWNKRWTVEFSRFFNFPKPITDVLGSGKRKPLRRFKTLSRGTWITASSQAVLQIGRPQADTDPVISVSLRERMLEEHRISSLSIFWPQVACVSECPTRGSRVVFFSYTGSSGQRAKFAIRFHESSLVQGFLDFIENIPINKMPVCASSISCVDPASSDQIGSNGPENRSVDQSCSSNTPSPYTPILPVLSLTDHETRYSPQQFLLDDIEAFSGMPPSFQELLSQCSTQIGCQPQATTTETTQSPLRDSMNAGSIDDFLTSLEQLMEAGDADLKCQVQKCLEDACFRDILAKIETVIDELGGESAPPI